MEHPVVRARSADESPLVPGTVAAVLAVKRLHEAKSRLAASLGQTAGGDELGTAHRSLVLAMLLDTVAALRAAGVDRVVVVSPDDEVLQAARRGGVHGLPEAPAGPAESRIAGLNRAFADGAELVRRNWPPSHWVLLIQADLPAATGASVGEVITEAGGLVGDGIDQVMLADREGSGTVLLLRHASLTEVPRFGVGSAAAHRQAGAVELDPERTRWPDLRTDVDTADDLAAAAELGLGADTAAVLAHR